MMPVQEMKEFIPKQKWYRQAAAGKLYYFAAPARGVLRFLRSRLFFFSVRHLRFLENFMLEDELRERCLELLAKQEKDPLFIRTLLRPGKGCMEELDALYPFLDASSPENVLDSLRKLDQATERFWKDNFVCDIFDPWGEELLHAEIRKHSASFAHHELAAMLRPRRLHYAQEAQLALLRLAKKAKAEGAESVREALEAHARTYFYLDNSWESTKVLTAEDFRKKMEALFEEDIDAQIAELQIDWKKEQERIAKERGLPEGLLSFLSFFRELYHLRDVRKRYTLLCNHHYDTLYAALSSFLSLPPEEMRAIMVPDLSGSLDRERCHALHEEREETVMFCSSEGTPFLLAGKDAGELHALLHATFDTGGKLLKGKCGHPGKVEGTARVVMGETHFSKFNAGDILVAPMTRPEYVPLMKKAKAIITDEGGITSHASIISRELNVPCVIGTKVATKMLCDGDRVEVDAEKGEVRVL